MHLARTLGVIATFALASTTTACGDDESSPSGSGGGSSTGGSGGGGGETSGVGGGAGSGSGGASSGGGTAGAGGDAAGGVGGGAGSGAGGASSSGSDGRVLYSDQIGLYRVLEGQTTELGTGPDYRTLTNLRLSPDGLNLMHVAGRDLRVTSTDDGSFVVGPLPGAPATWRSSDEAVGFVPGATVPTSYELVAIGLDASTTALVDSGGKEYCTGGPRSLSPDGSKIILRCGYGNNGELVLGDFSSMTVTGQGNTKITTTGTPPIWTGNDYIAHINDGGELEFNTPAFDAPVVVSGQVGTILPAGPDAVLAIGTEVGTGGLNINTYRKVSVPSGAIEEMPWLADYMPSFEKVVFNRDGSRVLYADGNGITHALVDGSDKVVVKEPSTGALAPALQSITW